MVMEALCEPIATAVRSHHPLKLATELTPEHSLRRRPTHQQWAPANGRSRRGAEGRAFFGSPCRAQPRSAVLSRGVRHGRAEFRWTPVETALPSGRRQRRARRGGDVAGASRSCRSAARAGAGRDRHFQCAGARRSSGSSSAPRRLKRRCRTDEADRARVEPRRRFQRRAPHAGARSTPMPALALISHPGAPPWKPRSWSVQQPPSAGRARLYRAGAPRQVD